jgi:tetratricopeptide (TPR) repeat protein
VAKNEEQDGGEEGAGRRPGRQTTFVHPAYEAPSGRNAGPADMVDPEVTGEEEAQGFDAFHQPTVMFDKGEFLGELAELSEGAPATRAQVDAEKSPGGFRLIAVAGPELGKDWAFKAREVNIGRDDDCELSFADIAVSRRHCQIVLEGMRFIIRDLGSGNGTFVNGSRFEEHVLSPGDEIIVGERTLRFMELAEAPPTRASFPAVGVDGDPALGAYSQVVEAEGLSRQPQVSEHRSAIKSVAVGAAVPEGEASGALDQWRSSLQRVRRALVAVTVAAAIGLVGYMAYQKFVVEARAAERLAEANQMFLTSIELIRLERFGDAIVVLERVLALRPGYDRALEYKAYAEREVEAFERLRAIERLVQAERLVEALDNAEAFPSTSAYKARADVLRTRILRSIALALVAEAQEATNAGRFVEAQDLLSRAEKRTPKLAEVARVRRQIDEEEARIRAIEEQKPKPFRVPPSLRDAVKLYEQGEIPEALDTLDAVGGPEAMTWRSRMVQMASSLERVRNAHRKKGSGTLIELIPGALDEDKKVAGGKGVLRQELEEAYADALYLKGIDAFLLDDYGQAYRRFQLALEIRGDHQLARQGMASLEAKADAYFRDAASLPQEELDRAKRLMNRVVAMTSPRNALHRRAEEWLTANP